MRNRNLAPDLLRQLRRTRRVARRQQELLLTVSHELRAPVGAILGFAELLLDADLTPRERQDHARTIRRSGAHLLSIVDDLLELPRPAGGRGALSIERSPCAPRQVVDEVVELLQARATEKGLRCEVAIGEEVPQSIHTDPTRLRQVLINLLANAIKFTPRGRVRVAVQGEGSWLRFAVTDTGVGLSAAQRQRLFRPFTQADRSIAQRFGGTGLGLWISRRLARLLGGDIAVQSAPGGGSTFTLRIATGAAAPQAQTQALTSCAGPRRERARAGAYRERDPRWGPERNPGRRPERNPARGPERNPARSQGRGPGRGQWPEGGRGPGRGQWPEGERGRGAGVLRPLRGRILLAEDGDDSRRLIAAYLRAAGATVCLVPDGGAAVARARGESFDLILLDLQMPVLDGLSATAALRRGGYRGPIVALTAHALPAERARCLAAGCDEWLSKPVGRAQLLQVTARLLQGARPRAGGVRRSASRPRPQPAARPTGQPTGQSTGQPTGQSTGQPTRRSGSRPTPPQPPQPPQQPPPDVADSAQRSAAPFTEPLRSVFADDPDLAVLLPRFVAGLAQKSAALREAVERADRQALHELSHQLKGAAGGYGYPRITQAAGAVERAALAEPQATLQRRVEELIVLCQRAALVLTERSA